ncbi:hypothetical protein F5Y19DRAFT_309716 [Xylariaceae sp. FL1651]|nr:hypothetical protein F5Y19DRAFT_309716 [Xylariaceae sp. FL1651]
MPYSDNMYSMEDDSSDGEDYARQLSPTDGDSNGSSSNISPHVPNILISDPTLAQRAEIGAETKAQEADKERLLNSQTDLGGHHSQATGQPEQSPTAAFGSPQHYYSSITYSQSSASRTSLPRLSSQAQTPVYADAPPAYTPSPISPFPSASPSQHNRIRNYSTFSIAMGQSDVENERLLGSQPESMGPPVDEESGMPTWVRRARRRLPTWLSWKYALLALLILIVSIVLLSTSVFSSSRPNKGNDTSKRPTKPINNGTSPEEPVEHEPLFQPTYCDGKQHRFNDQILALDFERARNLTFKETGYKHAGVSTVRVRGQVNVRKLNKGDKPRLVLEIVTNDPDLHLYTSIDENLQAIEVSIPEKHESSIAGQTPCVEMMGTIWVPEEAEIGTLSIRATHLDVLLFDDVTLHVADYTSISSVVGDINSGASKSVSYENMDVESSNRPDFKFVPAKDSYVFDSRIIEVSTISGKIDGNWPLYDMLGLHTTSGVVKVSITPKEKLETQPKPAVLSLSSISGAISAVEPIHKHGQIPLRDYLVDVKSTSGSIQGALAFGPGITLRSISSSLAFNLLPVVNADKLSPQEPAQLETTTTSGATAVRILKPIWFDGNDKTAAAATSKGAVVEQMSRGLDCLEAVHTSIRGNIELHYPQSWVGSLYAEAISGQIRAKGKDLEIIKQPGGWPGSKMEARKGPVGQASTIKVHTSFGNVEAIVGDER